MKRKYLKPSEIYSLLKTSLAYQTKEFFNNSTLHGVRYIAEKGRSFAEKFMWFSLVAVGAVSAFVIIGSLWEKFQTNPTITGLDTDFHNQQVLFPTVTVCPIESFDLELVNETAHSNLDSSKDNYDEYIPILKLLPQMAYGKFRSMSRALLNMSTELNVKNKNLRQLTFKVAVKCQELFSMCKYKDEEIPCCEYFHPVYTENGFCFSFNARYFGSDDEEIRNDRINDLFETDKKWALLFVPTKMSQVYLNSVDEVSGYDFRPTFEWQTGYSIDLLITLKQTYTTDDARQLSVTQRQCIFPDEIKLKYYKDDIYSFSGCMKQCRMENANRLCQCIPPFYKPASGNYRQCSIEDFICLLKYNDNITDIKGCRHCELSCLNTVYDIEKFTKPIVADSTNPEDYRVIIEFLTWPIIRYKREVLFGWVDLLVSFGGIAGLFLGFSLLSGVEIIYYFTMRAGCMIYKNREELYAIRAEDESQSIAQYDLSLLPKLKQSDRIKSLSMSNVHAVKPVESAGSSKAVRQLRAFDSPKVPIKKNNGQIISIKTKIEVSDGYGQLGIKRKQFNPPRPQNIFRSIQIAPYSTQIRPLDKKFRFRSQSEGPEVIFDGYLP